MAGASMNDIKARMKSVRSTMQITKAMELVATSKLRRAKEAAERTRPFYEALGDAIAKVMCSDDFEPSALTKPREVKKTLYVVIAGDRGLAGGYNANVFRLGEALSKKGEAIWLPIGRKAQEYFTRRGREMLTNVYQYVQDIGVGDALTLGNIITEGYCKGEYDRVVLIYTKFMSMLTQTPAYEQLLPIEKSNKKESTPPEFDTDPTEMLQRIIPQYIGGIIWSAIKEAVASEDGSRRNAMSAANKNAAEMIDTLVLKYNRARQAVITQEITEIVSGAEAL